MGNRASSALQNDSKASEAVPLKTNHKQPLWMVVEEALRSQLPDGGTRDALAQLIADFCWGIDISPDLLDRSDVLRLHDYEQMGLNATQRELLSNIEAYNIVIPDEQAELVVDRRSIYDPAMDKSTYSVDRDLQLIDLAFKKWFKQTVLLHGRAPGADHGLVERAVESLTPIQKAVGIYFLRVGNWCTTYQIPHVLHQIEGHKNDKPMYIEIHLVLLNGTQQRMFDCVSLWAHKELRFSVDYMTYSDSRRTHTIHTPTTRTMKKLARLRSEAQSKLEE